MKKPPKRPRRPNGPANRDVAVLVYDGLCTFEFGIAVEMFGLPRPEFDDWYRFGLCAVDDGPMRAAGGMHVLAEGGLDGIARAGTVIVPGWRGVDAPPPAALLDALRKAHARGARLMSFCSGVFVLAASGLLDGRRATTHWRYVQALAERFPRIQIEPEVLYVDEGDLLTSAGSAAALDLSLHLIRRDFGPEMANAVARRAVVPAHRDGGQAQFIQSPLPEQGATLGKLLEWMRRHLEQPLPLSLLAERARMSERTLLRRFEEATGCSPKQWLTHERLSRARELLEGSNMAVERVADVCGFGSADTLRHHFRRSLKLSPARYRERFAHQ
ncbi:transcriptional regulator FtrA [Dyella sp. Tek66A03]|uniref:transcriptional regulator FtrA n=1 Tax=Dyella sp. Tek66A03 TaxID=3458298 RepID=UPI00403E3AD0